ncbi:MAG: biotin synthase BioB [Phycisphaeraceae bacterium]|nr:biotin synthase BioB [Phycisphaeraceae bacterium]MCB9847395.1 biotin synthase BioB [Phycisphaeraceae bacterium]
MLTEPSAKTQGLSDRYAALTETGLADEAIPREEALSLLGGDPHEELWPLVQAAGLVRRRYFGDLVRVHRLNNVKSGACPEDCGYCGQSKDSEAPIRAYKLQSKESILAEAAQAKASGAFRYCMALAGTGPTDAEIDHMVDCIAEVKSRFGLETCLSAGLMDEAKARRLKDAGLDRLNHNLNTSEAMYPEICTTHTYAQRVETLHAAKAAGLGLCSGVIVGMGETRGDLVETMYALRELRAESIPVNFLLPIEGNRVLRDEHHGAPLTPAVCLRILCVFRLVNPSAEIRMAAGREQHLRSLQAAALEPANSLFVDGYLLTKGSGVESAMRLILDAGMRPEFDGDTPEGLRGLLESRGAYAPIKDEKLSESKLAKLHVRGVETKECADAACSPSPGNDHAR